MNPNELNDIRESINALNGGWKTVGLALLAEIDRLSPKTNPEWEPCEIAEATGVMNSRGGCAKV